MDFRYFKRLTPYEFILWNKLKKHEKPNRAPNIYVAIQNFNALNCLVKSEVVMGDKPKSRALVISRWIQTAQVRVRVRAVVRGIGLGSIFAPPCLAGLSGTEQLQFGDDDRECAGRLRRTSAQADLEGTRPYLFIHS